MASSSKEKEQPPSHKWEAAAKIGGMKIDEDVDANLMHMPPVIDPSECERYVEELKRFSVEEVGTSEWFEQHRRIEKLNLQAHHSAVTNNDEYVLESILTFSKLHVLIHNLLAIEVWKEKLYPKLLDTLAGKNSMRIYFILYHEATLVNLLEVLLYHKHVCVAGGENMLELVDYVARKLTRIHSGTDFRQSEVVSAATNSAAVKDLAVKLESRNPVEELNQHFAEIEFKVCISACSLCRFLCEHADSLVLSVVTRITDTHDMLILVIPLIENPPWTRRTDAGKWQKLVEQKWTDVKPLDLLKITKLEGQPWLALYHLLAKQVFRDRYHLNTFRKGQLLRVRKYINDTLLDQLPFLADIQRYMDELALTEVPEPQDSSNSVFMFQQVAVVRESLVKNKDWDMIARDQIVNTYTMTDKNDKDLTKLADLYSDDLAENVFDPDSYLEKVSALNNSDNQ